MSLKHFVSHIRLRSALPAALMLVILLGLGTWQIQRLHWKENLIATISARIHEPPVDAETLTLSQTADYRPATASGVYLHDHSFYLFALSLKGDGGYHILTPMRLSSGRYLLVDRGFTPYNHKMDITHPEGLSHISGILRIPEHHLFRPPNDVAHNNWYGVDLVAMSETAGLPLLLPYVLELDASQNGNFYPLGGQTRITLPNNHLGYALTWYGLALIWIVIYGRLVWLKNVANLKAEATKV